MSDGPYTANIMLQNNTGDTAWMALFYEYSTLTSDPSNQANVTGLVGNGGSIGQISATYYTGAGTRCWWGAVVITQSDGQMYWVDWNHSALDSHDDGKTETFTISTSELSIVKQDGTVKFSLTKGAQYSDLQLPGGPITNVFVLMLENHSFDNLLAMSGIEGIIAATGNNYNLDASGEERNVQDNAPVPMPTDPGHEFLDTLQQLCQGVTNGVLDPDPPTYTSGGPYPAITNAGFVENYATSTTEGPAPPQNLIGYIMSCFATPTQLPVLYSLATNFMVCDSWYSSMPGPTWPNRFFVHGASSGGWDDSPSTAQMAAWELDGFTYPNGSIYDAMDNAGITYRFYNDATLLSTESAYSDDPGDGSALGAVPQVTALSGVNILDIFSVHDHLASDLQGPYPFPYTFIEPNYGDVTSGTYAGGSSQHPMDDAYGGEALLKAVYEAIRNSPYWDTSVLIITYDEHGGFYDSVAPPAAVPPGDGASGLDHGFTFEQYGIRVPSIIVSPLIPAGVTHDVFDHTSILSSIESMLGLSPLTDRDAGAQTIWSLFTESSPRFDCPVTLPDPAPTSSQPTAGDAKPRARSMKEELQNQRMPDYGNLRGMLGILRKIEREVAPEAGWRDITTRGDVEVYAREVMEKVMAERQRRAPSRLRNAEDQE